MTQDENALPKEITGSAGKGKLMMIVVIAAVVAVFSGGGYFVGTKLRHPPDSGSPAEAAGPTEPPPQALKPGQDYEYIELPSFVATLNTPRRDRFLSLTIALAVHPDNKKAVDELMAKKKIELDSQITLYLNGRSLEDLSGSKNLNRMLRELQELLGEHLWPNQKSLIENVLVKNLVIQ